MPNAVIVVAAIVLLGGLLYFERKESTWGKLLTKTPLSCLFIVAVLLQPHPNQWYFHFLFLGLVFCLGGDVCLAIPSEKTFLAGLISFLAGHVFYVFAFAGLAAPGSWFSTGGLIIFIMSALIFLYLRPHLGKMTGPVIAYVVVISIMLTAALAVLTGIEIGRMGKTMIFIGALLFYLSDLFVARDRFIKNESLNRFIGLPMYYGGQFLLAFSVGSVEKMV